jgi:hypothetical protein
MNGFIAFICTLHVLPLSPEATEAILQEYHAQNGFFASSLVGEADAQRASGEGCLEVFLKLS